MKYYKVLKSGGRCVYGQGSWYLPKGDKPGEWMPKIKELVVCESGYHLCRENDLIEWLNEEIYEVEYRGVVLESTDKIVVHEARLIRKIDNWNEKTARLFAVKCVKRVLKIWDKYYPKDKRPHEAVKQAYLFALGKTTREKMVAAGAAARDAARAAARDAAWAAERRWQTKTLIKMLTELSGESNDS